MPKRLHAQKMHPWWEPKFVTCENTAKYIHLWNNRYNTNRQTILYKSTHGESMTCSKDAPLMRAQVLKLWWKYEMSGQFEPFEHTNRSQCIQAPHIGLQEAQVLWTQTQILIFSKFSTQKKFVHDSWKCVKWREISGKIAHCTLLFQRNCKKFTSNCLKNHIHTHTDVCVCKESLIPIYVHYPEKTCSSSTCHTHVPTLPWKDM